MTELSVQEKLLKLQAMGKMPYDNQPSLGEYLQLAMELAECKTKIAEANKILSEIATYPEYQGFIENNIIPCQAPCARQYEDLCRCIQELQFALNDNNKIKEP